jgi:hypothetical protein
VFKVLQLSRFACTHSVLGEFRSRDASM